MEITYGRKGLTQKVAEVNKVEHESDDEILDFAIAYFGESRDSLYGWHIQTREDESEVTVYLYTD